MPGDVAVVAVPPLVTIPNVDILAAGTWRLSTGEATFTPEDLAAAVDASRCPAVGPPKIKLGHADPRFSAEPAVGRVINLALAAEGNKVTGDMAGMPGWLGEIMATAYPQRSIEGKWDHTCQIGHVHPFVITSLALLGVTPPGVGVLSGLDDIAELFGVTADVADGPGRTWTLTEGLMDPVTLAAGVTVEDVRRAYFATPGISMSYWITELQIDPPQLIVADEATNQVYRVPVTIKGSEVTFGDPVEVAVEYVDVKKKKAAAAAWASAAESRAGVAAAWDGAAQVKNMGDDPSAAALKAMFALPGDSKSASKLPHHTCTGGKVGAADPDGCSAAIGAINGARGGLKGVSGADLKAAYSHLAAHLRKAGQEPPEYSGPAAEAAAGDPAPDHSAAGTAAEPVTHSHAHPANGSQGGDKTHTHEHSHAGDANHAHAHAQAAGTNRNGGADVDFTDEHMTSLRASLGLDEGAELTPDGLVSACQALRERADAQVQAASGLPPTVIAVDRTVFEDLKKEVEAGAAFRKKTLAQDRDKEIQAAVGDGRVPRANIGVWQGEWDKNPEGTRALLASLPKNVIPVRDVGQPGGEPADDDMPGSPYAELFGTGQ